jgi:hypothetical protein
MIGHLRNLGTGRLRHTLLTVLVLVCSPLHATVTLQYDCQKKFSGTIHRIVASQVSSLSSAPKVFLQLVDIIDVKGAGTQTMIEVVKDCYFSFQEGERVRVGLEDGYICVLEKI